jgi:YARHG domain-containing protein
MRVLSAFSLTIVVLGVTSAQSYAATCQQLWVERNSIYKSGGYCFKTPRAIAHFGNAGCLHDSEGDVPLSAAQRRHIGSIVAEERAQACGD